ncbi:MAG: insulinase family protein [Candidatus Thiodiazotropha sp. (ex Lucinoma aequizonata)]|nr:insulinase family protein [Candidatus Thiodiazotropha sp. (ex Lucinoma aequizonata)]MCU7886919.1 insulinase family protein [Candidatus Thiodiazotropha sp. (ex Lucinoma aequizonata)]MCU7893659.1 insulinase family protein [Candidatus Thiodiazotropha sp. (ex Lucinoma aequizonata)]MCU7899372.1 insulinase family protein [Candidatus Thiodiazotropha sp. (ex Lucinoma aequizonata)]MCU7902144.1 insulinase family protein [Candidatus Thiodiazotropha sp. (ex Lucinoma aequizonata)]
MSHAHAKVVEHQLENGMKVIVKQDRRAPIAVSQVWYKVGSSYEHGGITGVSHVLEHMMFKGTKQYPPGEFSRIIAANGGDENAFTGRDYTAYFQTMSSDRLDVSFKLEADRMRNLLLLPEEFKKEVEVVKEERRMRTEDKPQSLTYEQFLAGAYEASPYRIPVIGWMADLDALQVEDLQVWYRKWYVPNNATLVVVGDVEPDQVIQLAQRYFGPLKPEQVAQPKPRTEPGQRGGKRFTVKTPARQPYLILGYKTPVIGKAEQAWEPYALEMLAYVLDGGSSARLSNNLIRGSKLAVAADSSYSAFSRLPGMLVIDAVPTPGTTTDTVEAALLKEIDRFKQELVKEEEMERVRNQIIAAKVYEKDSVFYQAMLIGQMETVGLNWRLADEYVTHLKAVTAEQIKQVAEKYLVVDNLSVAVLEPLPMDNLMAKQSAAGGSHDH